MEVTPAVKPTSKAGASYNETRILVASFVAGSAKCACCSSAVSPGVMEKGALAGIFVVWVMPLVRVVVCVVRGLFVECCDGVAV